ncbi:methyl-accepting chemotaxis protein [Chitinimonas sp. JJ19]|uniref:methyl-accepting chemotaxis protein n=1 Tax=Chitinimonas sp. JJ19 TaxID=3109352 RepID=UPI00300360FD
MTLANIPIRGKLLLLLALPLLCLLLAAASWAWSGYQLAQQLEATARLTVLADRAGTLIHTLQVERGTSAGFLSKADGNAGVLVEPRTKSDQAVADWRAALAANPAEGQLGQMLTRSIAGLAALSNVRSEVDRRGLAPAAAISAYSERIETLLGVVDQLALVNDEPELLRQTQALIGLLCYKEESGRERALLNGAFSAGKIDLAQGLKVSSNVARQQVCARQFDQYAGAALRQQHAELQQSSDFTGTAALRQQALAAIGAEQLQGDAQQWFATSTARINALHKLQGSLLSELSGTATSRRDAAYQQLYGSLGLLAGVLLVVGAIVLVVARSIIHPIQRLEGVMDGVREHLDLTERVRLPGTDELARIGRAFDLLLDKLAETLGDIGQRAVAVTGASQQMASTAGEVAGASHLQSEAVSAIAAAVEEMSVSISAVAAITTDSKTHAMRTQSLAGQGAEIAGKTVGEMEQMREQVDESSAALARLREHSGAIGEIVGLIRDISDQTNLLALNAAIEAARAGEQGRGFAVVADEVRKLAERASKATSEISLLINHIQTDTVQSADAMQQSCGRMDGGVQLVRSAAEALQRINDEAVITGQDSNQIAAAMQEQQVASGQVANRVEQIAQLAEENSRSIDRAADLAGQLDQLAGELQSLLRRFRLA